jgi:8-amino-7-oxononanoate synthase
MKRSASRIQRRSVRRTRSTASTKGAPEGNGSPSNGRQRVRADFLAPFVPLLQQIEAARAADLYPFFAADRDSAANGRPVVLVANDYLGLSTDPRVRAAAREAIDRFGTSRCASPLAGGQTNLHRQLEERLAGFLRQEAVAIFASGYQANVGVISGLLRPGDLVLTDLFDHASIIDGARLSGAQLRHFQHNDPSHLRRILQDARGRRALIVVEGVYSADGDLGMLPEVCDAAHAQGALVMVDEAHALGVLGTGGRGATEHFGLLGSVDLIMGTMSKSLASVGGFVAGDRNLVDAIAHSARSLIFSAALPPAGAAAALAALEIIEGEPDRRERLWRNARAMLDGLNTRGFDTMGSVTPVIPVLVGDAQRAIELTARLRERGVHICPAVPPMVPAHRSRVRAHVTASHEAADIDFAVDNIDSLGTALCVPRRQSVRLAGPGRSLATRPGQ